MKTDSLRFKKLNMYNLHGEEHFQFICEFLKEAEKANVIKLVQDKFTQLVSLYNMEDELLEKIHTSPLTEKIEKADNDRDCTYIGFRDIVKGMQLHYEPAKSEAAMNLMTVFNTYGKITHKSYSDATCLLQNFLHEIRENYAKDVKTLNLEGWVNKLEETNKSFSDMMIEGEKPKCTMSEIKSQIDDCYGDIVRCLEALAILNADHKLETFFNTINSNVERYKKLLAQRAGKMAANN